MAKLSVDQALLKAKSHTKKGEIEEAIKLYQAVLQAFPKNKRAQQGLAALNTLKQPASTQNPPQEVINQLINLYNQGQLKAVVEQATTITERYPLAFIVWNILGAANKGLGRSRQALEAFKKVTLAKPDFADGYNNLGAALQLEGKIKQAISAYKKALFLKPNFAEAHNNIGNAFKDLGQLEEAMVAYSEALALKPNYSTAYFNLGNVMSQRGDLSKAIKAYQKAVLIKPDYEEAINNLGNALSEQGLLIEAVKVYEKALKLTPNNAATYYNLANNLKKQGKLTEAIEAFKKAIAIKPDYADAHLKAGLTLLNLGKLKEGLDEYEWRLKRPSFSSHLRHFSKPIWEGNRDISDKTIFLWSEQGPGDVVMWLSVLKFLTPLAKHCIIECPKKLQNLLERSFPDVEVRVENRDADLETNEFDFHLPIGSLFRHFLPEITKNQAMNSYLVPDPLKIVSWKKRLHSLSRCPFIGISWKSPLMTLNRLPNYTSIIDWEPVLSIPNVAFVNLQPKEFEQDLTQIKEKFGVKIYNFDEIDHYDDLDEVAALVAALDMCVSVSTAVSTISAAVGTPTKMLHWRQSSWNNILFTPQGPSVDIFERNTWETWEKAFKAIAKDIRSLGLQ